MWGVDAAGNVYISDTVNNRIRKVDTHGIITTVVGTGAAGASGDGGSATKATLNLPSGIYVEAAGDLLIADYFNHRIRKVIAQGVTTTIAGNGSPGLTGDGGPATNASLNSPTGMTVDQGGNILIVDYGNSRIRRVDTNGTITTIAGSLPGLPGYNLGDGGAATNAILMEPCRAITDGSGNLYLTDTYDGLIRQVDTNGIITSPITGLSSPYGLALDPAQNLYVADAGHNRIAEVALLGLPVLSLSQATLTNAGNYYVIVSDSHGSVTSSVATLTVNLPAYVMTPPSGQSVSVGSNAVFNVVAGGTLPISYQWLHDGISLPDATNATCSVFLHGTNQAGGYSVVVANNYGSMTSSVATLAVLLIPPGIALPPLSQTVPYGSNAVFSVTPSGSPPFGCQWFFNGSIMGAQTNASLSLPGVNTNQAGGYSVVITNLCGSITSRIATLAIGWWPLITSQPTNQAGLAGTRALLAAGISGIGPFTFQWQLNGTNLPNNVITTLAGNGTNGFAGDGGLATTAKISVVSGLAADNGGDVLIADASQLSQQFGLPPNYSSNYRIRKLAANGLITTVAGTNGYGFTGDGGQATYARINSADGVAVDGVGNLYIADTGNSRVRKVDTNGIITTVAGKGAFGGSLGDGGAATNAWLAGPNGVAVDAAGNLFIADTLHERIRKVDTNGVITTVAGNSGAGFSGDGGAATNASFMQPWAVAVDAAGNLFVADPANARIRRVDTNGLITTVAGNGSSFFSGDGGMATNAGLYEPYGIALDNYGDLFIADAGHFRIRRVDTYGIITTVAGTNAVLPGSAYGYNGDGMDPTNATLFNPCGVVVDAYGRPVIADTSNYRIRRFGQGPVLVLDKLAPTSAGNYTLIISSKFGSVTSSVAALTVLFPPAIVSQPTNQSVGLGSNVTFTVSMTGTAPLACQWRLNGTNLPGETSQSLNLVNAQWTDAGAYGVVITNNYGSVTSSVAVLTVVWPPVITHQPASLMVLAGETVTLSVGVTGAGPFSYRWQLNATNLSDGIISTLAGNGAAGYAGDGGVATNASLKPNGVALDAAGNLYVAEAGNQLIRRVDTNGWITTVAGTGTPGFSGDGGPATNATFKNPFAVATDPVGDLLVADGYNNRLRKIDPSGQISTLAGDSAYGYAGDGKAATNTSLYNPWGLTVDGVGNVFFSDEYNYRLRKVNTNGLVSTVAGGGANDPGKGGAATSAKLYDPLGVAVDAAGNVYFADDTYRRIYRVSTNGTIQPFAGSGTNGFSGDGGPATNANLSRPTGVALDSGGNVFFADTSNYRIRKVDVNGIITTVVGSGAYGFGGDGGPATDAALKSPFGVAVDAFDNLFISDNLSYRIRKVANTHLPNLVLNNVSPANAGTYQVVVSAPGGVLTSSNVTLTVITAPALLSTPEFDAHGNLTLNLATTPNLSSRIFVATNLSPPVVWRPMFTNLAGGTWQFTDTNAPGQPQEFYRITTPQIRT